MRRRAIGIILIVALSGFLMGFDGSLSPRGPVLVLVGLLGFVASFAFSLGGGMWVLFSEIFPNRIRGLAISRVGVVNSLVCVVVQWVFPWEMSELGAARSFVIFGTCALIGVVLIARLVPETRGRSLEELEESLVRRG